MTRTITKGDNKKLKNMLRSKENIFVHVRVNDVEIEYGKNHKRIQWRTRFRYLEMKLVTIAME